VSSRPPTTTENRLDWTLFLLLSFMWGSSYLFIRIGVDEGLEPLTLIMLRLLFGALLLVGVALVARPAFPERRRTYGHLVVMSLLSIVIPFWLITYGEGSGVDSSVASILNSTVPLFTIVIAPLFLPDEAVKQRLATLCLRDGKSLIYIAVCPWHTPTADVNSTGKCFTWDVETGMAHCFWCGWGGRVARPLTGPVHPDLLPATFRLVLVT